MSLTVSQTTFGRSIAVLAICGTLAACGSSGEAESSSGSNGTSSDSSSSAGGGDQDAGRVRLTQCLRENGVDVPDNAGPGSGGGAGGAGNVDRDKLQEAMNGPCKKYQTEAFGNVSEEDRQEMQDSFQKFSQCMRDNGVDVPDIGSGDGPPAGGGGIDQDDPDVQAAAKKCQSTLPQGGPGGGGQ
jgi:hypothetical protein